MITRKRLSQKLYKSYFFLAFICSSFFITSTLVQAQSDTTNVDDMHTLPKSNKGEGLDEYVIAEQLRMTQKYPKAIAFYDQAIAKEPNNLEYLYNKCMCYYEGRNFAAAEPCFQSVLEKKANYIPAYEMLANTYKQKKEYDNAVSMYDKIISIAEDDGEKFAYQFRTIDLLFRTGNVEKAGKYIKSANELFPGMPDLFYLQARYENTVGNNEKALELMTQLMEITGGETGIGYDKDFYELGYTHFKLGNYAEAERAFSKITKGSQFAARANEFSPEFLMKVANGYSKVYEFNDARQLLEKVIAMRDPFPDAQELKSYIENKADKDTLLQKLNFRLEMNEKARSGKLEGDQDPRKFMLNTPQKLEIYGKLTKVYLELANYDDALEYSRQYTAIDPRNPLILFYQALALQKVGDEVEAESLLLAISSTPQINRNARAMAAFALGIFQHRGKQYALAVKNLKKAAILSPAFGPASKYEIASISVEDPDSAMDEDMEEEVEE
ncbi:tetratricopeptide repeat protein [Bernardetia sp.]|uniref:tetratricopeptide repeat protein n=1 Tax=Bernardetia sp. TaxID=1937974 RepID=UPI0025C6B206|nr:tetratricopeptide repeat protein [Bernardetia sp.]